MKVRSVTSALLLQLVMLLASCRDASQRHTIVVLTQFATGTPAYVTLDKSLRQEFDSTRYRLILQNACDPSSEYVYKGEYFHDVGSVMEARLDALDCTPDLIMLQGAMLAYSGALSRHPLLQSVPVLCFNVANPQWEGILHKKNFVVMESRPAIRENINFIRNLHLSSWMVTCLDHTYLDDYLHKEIDRQIGYDSVRYHVEYHPRMSQMISPEHRDSTCSTLIPISLVHPENELSDSTAATWYDSNGFMQLQENGMTFLRIKDDSYGNLALEYNLGLFLTLCPDVFNLPVTRALNGCLGGYLTPWTEMMLEIHPIADQLLEGIKPSHIPWQKHHCDYWLDWRLASLIHPYAEDFPCYVHFVNLPWERTSRLHMFLYSYGLPLLLLLILGAIILIPALLAIKTYRQHILIVRQGENARITEHQIEDALAAAHAYHFFITPDGMLHLSDSVCRTLGIRPRPMLLDVVLRFVHQPMRDELRRFVVQSDEESRQMDVVAHSFRDGVDHAFLVQLTKIDDEHTGRLVTGIVMLNDEAFRVEEERKEAYRCSEEVTAKESFLAAMGHEIRTPLNAIVGFAQVLIDHHDDLSDEERSVYGQYIIESNDDLLHLLENVMNYSRSGGDSMHLELSRHNVTKLMEEVYITHSVIIPSHLSFNYHRGPEGLEVNVNRTSLHQVVSNLMNNAIKFTEKGGITIGWECEDAEFTPMSQFDESTPPSWVVIYVQDTGIGIAAEQQKQVFDRYFKQNNQTVGAGIGLSLCKDIIDQMGGNISVKSELRQGSRFEVRLPIIQHSASEL